MPLRCMGKTPTHKIAAIWYFEKTSTGEITLVLLVDVLEVSLFSFL